MLLLLTYCQSHAYDLANTSLCCCWEAERMPHMLHCHAKPHVGSCTQALQELVKRTTTQDEAAGSRRISDAWDASWEFEPSSKMTSSVRQPSALGVSRLPTGGSLGLSREESQQSEAEPPGPTYDNSISTVPTVGGDGSGGSRAFRQQGDANGGLQGQPRGYGLQGELPAGGIRKKGWKGESAGSRYSIFALAGP